MPSVTARTPAGQPFIVVFDSAALARTYRSRGFGAGLNRRLDQPSQADREWAAYHLNADCADYSVVGRSDAEHDRQAELAEAMDRYAAGLAWC